MGTAHMSHYRCYLLNSSGSILSVDSVEADDDDMAVFLATRLLRVKYTEFAAIEVWERKRLIGRIASGNANPVAMGSLLTPKKPEK